MRKNLSKTGYKCVYKTQDANTYYFESKLSNSFINKRHKECGFKTPEEANKAKLRYELNVMKENKEKRFKYLIDDYLNFKKTTIKLSSYYSLKILIDKYLADYKNKSYEYFATNENLDNYRNKINELNISTQWKNRILRTINEIYEYGALISVIEPTTYNLVKVKTNKIAQTIIENNKVNKDNNYWSIKEWKRFLSVIEDKDWKLFFTLFGQLGCRLGEIRGLQNKHILDKEIKIEQQAQDKCGAGKTLITTTKSPSSNRTVVVADKLLNLLKEYIKGKDKNNFLFFNTNAPIGSQTIRRKFNEYIKLAKLHPITIHGIRHSNCTWLLSQKLTPQEVGQVSKRLGHSSIKITLDIYMAIHKTENPLILEKLDQII